MNEARAIILSIEEEPFEQLVQLMLAARAMEQIRARALMPLEKVAINIITAMRGNGTKVVVRASKKVIVRASEVNECPGPR